MQAGTIVGIGATAPPSFAKTDGRPVSEQDLSAHRAAPRRPRPLAHH
jgi:hypothetical protein